MTAEQAGNKPHFLLAIWRCELKKLALKKSSLSSMNSRIEGDFFHFKNDIKEIQWRIQESCNYNNPEKE